MRCSESWCTYASQTKQLGKYVTFRETNKRENITMETKSTSQNNCKFCLKKNNVSLPQHKGNRHQPAESISHDFMHNSNNNTKPLT
jgi:hypothetical protein